MSAHALAALERYGAFPTAITAAPEHVVFARDQVADDVGTAADGRASYGWADYGTYLISYALDDNILLVENLMGSVLLRSFTSRTTSPPRGIRLELLRCEPTSQPESSGSTLAQDAIKEIKALSGLTNELIAPLMGVSRRSVQDWISGEPISQRNEQRLLALRDAVRSLSTGDHASTRRRLMDQAPGRVRVYDLLAAGEFDTAVDLATGRRRSSIPRPHKTRSEGLIAQLSRLEGRVEIVEAPSTGRFSGRLRR